MSVPRITRDPSSDVAPSRAVIVSALPSSCTQQDQDDAVARVEQAWQTEHDAQTAAWKAQCDADDAAATERELLAEEDRRRDEQAQVAAATAAEEAAATAKRPKFVVRDIEPPSSARLQAPASVRKDLKEGKWVSWHLMTPEMCREDLNSYQHAPGFKLSESESGEVVLMQSRRATKTPVIPDAKLSYEQWSSAVPIFLRTIRELGWETAVCNQWQDFFLLLQEHDARYESPKAIVAYAAGVRADWHRLYSDGQPVFNPARINTERLNKALIDAKLEVAIAEVIDPFNRVVMHLADLCLHSRMHRQPPLRSKLSHTLTHPVVR